MDVKAEVDLKEVKENLKRVKEDNNFAAKVKEKEKQLQELEDRVKKLQQQLANKDFDETVRIRQERKEVFDNIDELEKIKTEIKSKTTLAIEKVELGMTREEVKKMLGKPRSEEFGNYNYGNVWVIFNGGVVGCIIDAQSYFWAAPCSDYRRRGAVIK